LTPEPNIYTCRWVKVEYERTKQLEICRNILNPIFTSLDQPGTTEAMREVSEHPFVGYQRLLTATMDILLEEIVRFKSEAFNIEKEWRAVVRQREFYKQGTDDGGQNTCTSLLSDFAWNVGPLCETGSVEAREEATYSLYSVRPDTGHDDGNGCDLHDATEARVSRCEGARLQHNRAPLARNRSPFFSIPHVVTGVLQPSTSL
jgi:hypothetical protein